MKRILISAIAVIIISTALIAQPINYEWATDMGGRSQNIGRTDMVKYLDEYIFVYGDFQGTRNFGAISLTSSGSNDVFIALYDTTGLCIWAVQGGGTSGSVNAGGISIDNSGSVYVTGYFNFNMTFGVLGAIFTSGSTDVFIAKIDITGNPLWIRKAGGTAADEGYSIACDNSSIVLTGSFTSAATFGTVNLASSSPSDIDIFIAKYDLAGNCTWANKAGGTGSDKGYAIERDNANNIVLSGFFNGTATFGTNQVVSYGNNDVFLAKYNNSGVNQWVVKGGSSGNDNGHALGVDQSDNYYMVGDIGLASQFGTFSVSSDNYGNAFIAKYNSSGVAQWAKSGGSSTSDAAYAIAVHPSGGCYVTGYVNNFGIVFGPFNLASNGTADAFVVRLDPSGTFVQADNIGGVGNDNGKAILLGLNGDAYLAGEFISSMTVGTTTLTTTGVTWHTFLVGLHGGTVGINEINKTETIIPVYPNPASDKINFELPVTFSNNFSLEVFDLNGKMVLKEEFDSVNTKKITLDISGLKKGNYYFILSDGSKTARSEFAVVD